MKSRRAVTSLRTRSRPNAARRVRRSHVGSMGNGSESKRGLLVQEVEDLEGFTPGGYPSKDLGVEKEIVPLRQTRGWADGRRRRPQHEGLQDLGPGRLTTKNEGSVGPSKQHMPTCRLHLLLQCLV